MVLMDFHLQLMEASCLIICESHVFENLNYRVVHQIDFVHHHRSMIFQSEFTGEFSWANLGICLWFGQFLLRHPITQFCQRPV